MRNPPFKTTRQRHGRNRSAMPIVVLLVVAALAAGCSRTGPETTDAGKAVSMTRNETPNRIAVPPIDREAPERTLTATFAMG